MSQGVQLRRAGLDNYPSFPPQFVVRRVRPAETPAIRVLIPEVFTEAGAKELFVAVANDPYSIQGAGCLLPKPWGQNPSGFRFFLRVVMPYRRRGIGTALVSTLADEARRWGVPSLRAWQAFPDGPESMFLRSLGFKEAGGYMHFEADLDKLYSMLSPLRDRLVAGAKIPREARLTPLSDAPLEKVIDLHCRYLGGSRSLLARQMQGEGEHAFSPEDSVVLMMGDEVMGEALWRLEEETASVEGRVIDPRCRGSWANVLLMTTAAERGFARGARRVRFLCLDNNKDTRKLAKRCEASVKSSETFYALYL